MSVYFRAIAIDYDGTLAQEDRPSPDALEALEALQAEGVRTVLVTGRILEELRAVFPAVDPLFDAIVAENGAVLSVDGSARLLAAPVEFELDEALVGCSVPFRRGQALLATQSAHEAEVRAEIRRLGLELQLTMNRGEMMVLPPGVSKGSGVYQALGDLGISHHSAVAVGDGENDHSLLRSCELGVAVADAVEGLRRHADLVLDKPGPEGVAELLRGPVVRGETPVHARRWQVELGRERDGSRVLLPGSQSNLLVTGRTGSGKSFLMGLLAEQQIELGYSLCIVDPEGDYTPLGGLRGVIELGGREPLPDPDRIGRLVEHRFGSVLVDLSFTDPERRWCYTRALLDRLEAEREATGLPHWILCDEAHSALGEVTSELGERLRAGRKGYCLATYRPASLSEATRDAFDHLLALPGGRRIEGEDDPIDALERLYDLDLAEWDTRETREALWVPVASPAGARAFTPRVRRKPHVRHCHKYVAGRLPDHLRFTFRTEHGEPRSVAANVREFHGGLRRSPPTVLRHHAVRRDFSRWLAESLQDARLAARVRELERDFARTARSDAGAEDLRTALLEVVEKRYVE